MPPADGPALADVGRRGYRLCPEPIAEVPHGVAVELLTYLSNHPKQGAGLMDHRPVVVMDRRHQRPG